MAGPMNPLPTRADDPRLRGWYQTIELAPGLVTSDAVYDHRPIVDCVGLPPSLAGKTVLDVGTADGFWAFEMERRGADRVVAIDIGRMGQSDVIPRLKDTLPEGWAESENYCAERFWTAHTLRRSRVEYKACSIYELSPESVGTFDLVYCGSLLVHLFNPLQALINIRSVTRESAIIETCALDPNYESVEMAYPDRPYLRFGSDDADAEMPGRECMYWYFTQRALRDMLAYAGFLATEPRPPYRITGPGGGDCQVVTMTAHVDPNAMPKQPSKAQGYGDDLAAARTRIAELENQLHQYEGLGPRALGAARRLQRISRRWPRIASLLRKPAPAR